MTTGISRVLVPGGTGKTGSRGARRAPPTRPDPAEVRAFGAVAARTGVQRHPGNGGPPASAANRIGW
ncbi:MULTISPECIES: hypothetical protein [Streptomyces]|uniref:hypothetical protein n=1 Tax=Streptomyces TaxID=1883 RepID=UPI001E56A57A|nr:hypothetical protein [Streptomyces sp. 8ZJF_21]MCC4320423.1 hypothetical protein [Streptomyces malaysiensis]MCD9593096.1 hypothetical protein [Streptomyces sp. 8ZJF_21]